MSVKAILSKEPPSLPDNITIEALNFLLHSAVHLSCY